MVRLKFLHFMICLLPILEINELTSDTFKGSCTHQVDSGMELRNGLLAFLLSFFNPAEGLLVGPWAELGGQGSQSDIITWLLNRIKSFHFFGFFFWSYIEVTKKKKKSRITALSDKAWTLTWILTLLIPLTHLAVMHPSSQDASCLLLGLAAQNTSLYVTHVTYTGLFPLELLTWHTVSTKSLMILYSSPLRTIHL